MKMVNQAINVLINPKGALQNVRNEQVATRDIIMYLAIIGIPTLIGFIIGYGIIGWWGTFIGPAIVGAIIYYIIAIIGIVGFGFVFSALAPSFKTQQNQMQAMKLAAYAATPWLLAGIFYLYPPIWFLTTLAGLYGLYILYIGIPILMGTPQDQQIPYLVIGIIIYVVIMFVVWLIARQIWWGIAWSAAMGPW
jgi:hypothetical protein